MKIKFDNTDRRHVIDLLSEHVSSRLSRAENRHIYLKDNSGNRYVVLGGTGDWHGIPDDVIEDIEQNHLDSKLVVAIKNQKSLKIYWGEIKPLLKSLGKLPRPGNDKYTFHVDERHDYLSVREAKTVTLALFKEIPHTESDREKSKSNVQIENLLNQMSDDERRELHRKIKDGEI
jgi:hypothetical protein